MHSKINVTRSILPQKNDFNAIIDGVFNSTILTNNGPKCVELEKNIADFLKVHFLTLCSSGTSGLEIAIHAAKAAGKKIITTPFTYVATVSAALWVGCKVVFADIDPQTLAIDPKKIAEKIDADIAAIIPVNVYGHPCDYDGIKAAAGDVPVIYDAAQAFGAKLNGRDLLDFGEMAVCSLHATKVFHCVEGGFVVSHTMQERSRLCLLRAFGHDYEDHRCIGINAKMSEFHAAMGLSILKDFRKHLEARKKIDCYYRDAIKSVCFPATPSGFESNYGYFPVILDSEEQLLRVMALLEEKDIHPRRYFYPALSCLPYIEYQKCPVAEDIALRVLCLPIYSGLSEAEVVLIAETVNKGVRR